MNEKELLIQNATNAMPVAQQLLPIEEEINELGSIVYKPKSIMRLLGKILIILAINGFFFNNIGDALNEADVFMAISFIVIYGAIIYFLFIRGPIKKREAQEKLLVMQEQWKELVQDERLSWLPESYRRGHSAVAIYNYAINGRADSLKEALNLYETEKHHERVEFAAMLGAYNAAQY